MTEHFCGMRETERNSWGILGKGFRHKAGYLKVMFMLQVLAAQDAGVSLLALCKAENNLVCFTSK